MVKVQSSTGQIVMDYYNKYNLSLKYEEITNEQPSLIYSVSVFHNNTKIFSDNEIYYFNDDARNFIQENNNLEFNKPNKYLLLVKYLLVTIKEKLITNEYQKPMSNT